MTLCAKILLPCGIEMNRAYLLTIIDIINKINVYILIEGIESAINEQREKVLKAYQQVGNLSTFYDGMMTNSSLTGKLAIRWFWNLSDEKYDKFINQAFVGIPKNFDGQLLEIPIGTGVLSLPIYQKLNKAKIIGVDYSDAMLNAAKNNADTFNVNNVTFVQGDVKELPFDSNSFDIVLSINGFHVFPDKQSAYNETYRVLKTDGIFCGCMYVKDQNSLTDFFIKNFCERFGYFTPPYETIESLTTRLNKMYSKMEISHVESFAGFLCKK